MTFSSYMSKVCYWGRFLVLGGTILIALLYVGNSTFLSICTPILCFPDKLDPQSYLAIWPLDTKVVAADLSFETIKQRISDNSANLAMFIPGLKPQILHVLHALPVDSPFRIGLSKAFIAYLFEYIACLDPVSMDQAKHALISAEAPSIVFCFFIPVEELPGLSCFWADQLLVKLTISHQSIKLDCCLSNIFRTIHRVV